MAARSTGTATISFGLVSIPIKLYSTSESSSGISFNLLHDKCKGRLKQQYICPRDNNEIVDRGSIVKGYEFAKDQYVIFTEEELKALEEQATKTIEITEFVPLDRVDPLYFEKAYYVGPDKGAERAYRLLGLALRETGRCALARYAARGKQSLVLLRPFEEGLVMQELRYADEVKSFKEIDLGNAAEVKEAELKLATQLIAHGSNEQFQPEKYKDEVRARIQEQIQRKIAGESISAAPAPQAQIIDLMEALKASLAGKTSSAPAADTSSAVPAPEADAQAERKGPKRAPRKNTTAASKRAK
ncbi:MAG: Ku protein [Myxococcaceae bacterium]|nr:Ku protein [Myxococcaceae bacterium]